jgi:hypothetical protein
MDMIGGLMKTTSQIAIAAAASMLIGGVMMTSAKAADLGGDCCADLEERVAELEATTARKGNRNVSLTISGAVSYALIVWDDGFNNDTNVINPDTDGNGVNLDGKGSINSDLSTGYAIRLDLRRGNPFDGPSTDVDGDDNIDLGSLQNYTADLSSNFTVSQQFVFIESKSAGTIELGYRNGSYKSLNDGGIDLSGVDYMSASSGRAGGLRIVDAQSGLGGIPDGDPDPDVNTGSGALNWYDVIGNVGGAKDLIIRYNSPTLAGFALSAHWGGDDTAAIAGNYSGSFSGTDVAAGIAYEQSTTRSPSDFDNEKFMVAASIYNSSSGLFFTGEYNVGFTDAVGADDTTAYYLKGGWRKNVTGLGDTIVYGAYLNGDNFTQGVEARAWTIGMKQNIDKASSSLFWAYDNRSILEGDFLAGCENNDCGDLSTFTAGLKVTF